jgi:hypothetical protein
MTTCGRKRKENIFLVCGTVCRTASVVLVHHRGPTVLVGLHGDQPESVWSAHRSGIDSHAKSHPGIKRGVSTNNPQISILEGVCRVAATYSGVVVSLGSISNAR